MRTPGLIRAAAVLTGFAGSALIALAGSGVTDRDPIRWWFHLSLGSAALYAGLGLLCAAWLALGATLPEGRRGVPAIAVLWATPLVLGPPLFSHDVFSYLAQGTIVHLGLDPYQHGPAVLARHHELGVLRDVSPFWRSTPAPYGPGFLGLAALIAAAARHAPVLAVLLFRLPELAGMALLAAFVPRLAERLGADPRRAVWLVVLSPLALVELLASAHNDALMAGLMVWGVWLAVEERMVAAAAVCALAATVKLPAGLAEAFLLALIWRSGSPDRARRCLTVIGTGVAVAAAVTLVSGLGVDWISGGVVSTPAKVRLSITPATDIGWVLGRLLHDVGVAINVKNFEFTVAKWTLLIPVGVLVVALRRASPERWVGSLALVLLLLVVCGPASWPWYGIWALSLLACLPGPQRRRWVLVVVVVGVFLIRPDGRFALSLDFAPWVLALYAALALTWWWRTLRWQPRRRVAVLVP